MWLLDLHRRAKVPWGARADLGKESKVAGRLSSRRSPRLSRARQRRCRIADRHSWPCSLALLRTSEEAWCTPAVSTLFRSTTERPVQRDKDTRSGCQAIDSRPSPCH